MQAVDSIHHKFVHNMKTAQQQQEAFERSNAKASTLPQYQVAARGAKAELTGLKNGWKAEKANLLAQIGAANTAKVTAKEALGELKNEYSSLKMSSAEEIESFKTKYNQLYEEFLELKKHAGDLEVEKLKYELQAQASETIVKIHRGNANRAKASFFIAQEI